MKLLTAFYTVLIWLVFQPAQAEEIPAEAFFSPADYRQALLAPDGKHFAITVSMGEMTRLGIVNSKTRQLVAHFDTRKNREIYQIWWANHERVIFNTVIKFGWKDYPMFTGELFALNIDNTKKFPIAGFVAGDVGAFEVLDVMRNDPKSIRVVKKSIRGQRISGSRPTAYTLNVYRRPKRSTDSRTDTRRLKQKIVSPFPWGGFVTDNNGDVRIAHYMDKDGELKIKQRDDRENEWRDVKGFSTPMRNVVGADTRILGFTVDNKSFYYLAKGRYGTSALHVFNLETGQGSTLYENETYDIYERDLIRTSDDQIIGVNLSAVYPEVHFFVDHPDIEIFQTLHQTFSNQRVTIYNFSDDNSSALVDVRSDRNPGTLYFYDTERKKLRRLMYSRSGIEAEKMGRHIPFLFTSQDGLDIYGFVTLPDADGSNCPTVILIHGGPHGVRDTFLFDSEAQFFSSRGFAVVQVNYRGSGGYGADFVDQGAMQWGKGMIADINHAARWAIQQKISDPKRICAYGGSYGAFAAMNVVIQAPNLYQCAAGLAGVYDLTKMHDSDIPFLPWGKAYLKSVLGTDESELKAQSPSHNADKITVPVFIAHGGKDKRAPPIHAKNLRAAMDAANVEYEWLYEPDEGHGFYDLDHRLNFYTNLLAFLNRHIGTDP